MKRGILILISFFLAVLAEWSFGGASFGGIPPPLTLGVLFFWLLRLEFAPRMWLGLAAGFFLDSISALPFGAYLVTIFFLGLAVEVVREAFSSPETPIINSAGMAILIFLALIFLALISSPTTFPAAFSAALIWSIILAPALGGVLRLLRRFS